ISESEERSVVAALLSQPLHVEVKFAIEHRLQPVARNIAVCVPVDGVAHLHVVSRHALGDCARSAADSEKPAHHFLSAADLGKGFDGEPLLQQWFQVAAETDRPAACAPQNARSFDSLRMTDATCAVTSSGRTSSEEA